MTGIRTGSRLEQLHDLRRQITLQLEHARRTGTPTRALTDLAAAVDEQIRAEGGTPPPPPGYLVVRRPRRRHTTGPTAPRRAYVLLAELGVTSTEVKTWAVQHGLLDAVRRGQVSAAVVEAYAMHHTPRKAGTTP